MKNSWIDFKYKLPYEGVLGGNIGGDAPYDYIIIVALAYHPISTLKAMSKHIDIRRFIRFGDRLYILIYASQATRIYHSDEECRGYMLAWTSFDQYNSGC